LLIAFCFLLGVEALPRQAVCRLHSTLEFHGATGKFIS